MCGGNGQPGHLVEPEASGKSLANFKKHTIAALPFDGIHLAVYAPVTFRAPGPAFGARWTISFEGDGRWIREIM
jgi:hypothetical protein